MAKTPPKTVHLHWHTPSYGGGSFWVSEHKFTDSKEFHYLKSIEVDWGDVVFDEVEFKLKSLNKELGEAQGKVNHIKEEIAKLLAIGHEEPVEVSGGTQGTPHFDDNIPF